VNIEEEKYKNKIDYLFNFFYLFFVRNPFSVFCNRHHRIAVITEIITICLSIEELFISRLFLCENGGGNKYFSIVLLQCVIAL
jgi:hypothetical protein